jgi:NTE family protein
MNRGIESPIDLAIPNTGDVNRAELERGIALCLSGGGYRAMLFHLGAIWRLNELGYLPRLARISSVSGGSITAGVLGLKWRRLAFNNAGVADQIESELVGPVRQLASTTIDVPSVLFGALGRRSIGQRITNAYDRHLFRGATLQDLPDTPRFVFNATNIQSGALWRFMKPYMRDYRVGEVKSPKLRLAIAVAASAAFPPFLSPVRLRLKPSDYTPGDEALHMEPFTTNVLLSDGGVYDNIGVETAWKRYDTILVSDAGGFMAPEAKPKTDWLRQLPRILNLIDNQVRSLRKRQVVEAFKAGNRKGAYWSTRTDVANYPLDDPLYCPPEATRRLASVPTRLKRLDARTQEALINWGYAASDAAMRAHVTSGAEKSPVFPYPDVGVG